MRIPEYDQLYQTRVPSAGNPYPSHIPIAMADPEQVSGLVGGAVNAGIDYRQKVFDSEATAYYNENIVKLMADNERSKVELLNNVDDENAMKLPELYQQKVNENYANFQNSAAYNSRFTDMNQKLLKISRDTVISSIPSLTRSGAEYVEKSIIGRTDSAAESLGTTAISTGQDLKYILEGTANLYHNLGKQKAVAPLTLQKHTMQGLARQSARMFEDQIAKANKAIASQNYTTAANLLNKATDSLINEKYLAVPHENGVIKFYSYKNRSHQDVQKAADEINQDATDDSRAYVANVKYVLGEDFDKIYKSINKSRERLDRAMRSGKNSGSSRGDAAFGLGTFSSVPPVNFTFPGVANNPTDKQMGAVRKIQITNNGRQLVVRPIVSQSKSSSSAAVNLPPPRNVPSQLDAIWGGSR